MTMDWHFSSEESVVPSNRPALHSVDTLHLETKPTNEDNGLQPGCLHTVIPGRLCLVAHRDDDHTIAEIKKNPKVFFFSSELHEMYTVSQPTLNLPALVHPTHGLPRMSSWLE